jgi:Spy/CpxP family protein refolding chaperone
MRKLALLVTFALVASGTSVQAQGRGMGRASGRGGPGGPAAMMDRFLFKDITLTDAQKAKLEELRKAERDQMQAEGGRGRGGADFEAIREAREKGDTATVRRLMADQRGKMEARRDERISAIRAILNTNQLSQFDANVAEMKKRESDAPMGRGGRRGGPPPRP